MIYYVLKILCGEHSKSERAESAPPTLDRVNVDWHNKISVSCLDSISQDFINYE